MLYVILHPAQCRTRDRTRLNPALGRRPLVSFTRQTAQDPGYATRAAGATLLYYRQFGRTTGFASITLRGLEADERLFLYSERRRDLLLGISAGATLRRLQIRGFAPVLRVSYERNFSSVGICDYRRVATTLGITLAF